MKKRILSLAAASCLLLILAACGGGDAPQESPSGAPASEAPVQESAPAQDSSGLPTLEDYFNSDAMQELVDATSPSTAWRPPRRSAPSMPRPSSPPPRPAPTPTGAPPPS